MFHFIFCILKKKPRREDLIYELGTNNFFIHIVVNLVCNYLGRIPLDLGVMR
jgi:hypothetical protein